MDKDNVFERLCGDFLPVMRKLSGGGRFSAALGGSFGKGVTDASSDYDFRFYYDEPAGEEQTKLATGEISALMDLWKDRGVIIDSVWSRSSKSIDAMLDACYNGDCAPIDVEWTIWGYCVLTDIYNQYAIDDPFGMIADWKKRLEVYPKAYKEAVLKKYGSLMRYWRGDYHYRNKIKRADTMFAASLAVKLLYAVLQSVYALNEFYYPGDGYNLRYTLGFKLRPDDLETRAEAILYPGESAAACERQYENILSLIDDTLKLM